MNYSLLTVYADLVDDLEKSRIATENRIRSLRQIKGLAGSPEEERLDAIAMGLAQAERLATTELQRAVKVHPLGDWVGRQTGIGEKQAGRLLGVLGDLYQHSRARRFLTEPDEKELRELIESARTLCIDRLAGEGEEG